MVGAALPGGVDGGSGGPARAGGPGLSPGTGADGAVRQVTKVVPLTTRTCVSGKHAVRMARGRGGKQSSVYRDAWNLSFEAQSLNPGHVQGGIRIYNKAAEGAWS